MLIQNFSLGAYIGIYYEGIIILIIVILLIDLFRLLKTEKIVMARDLFYGYFFLAVAIFFSWLAKWYLWQLNTEFSIAAQNGDYFSKLIYKFKLSLSFAIIGHYFLVMFFRTIFSSELKRPLRNNKLILRKAIEVLFIILAPLIGIISGEYSVTMVIDGISFFILMVDAYFLLPSSKRAFNHSKDEKFGNKYRSIGLFALIYFACWIMLFCDRLMCVLKIPGLFGGLGFTVFYFLSWFLVLISLIYSIYGFVRK